MLLDYFTAFAKKTLIAGSGHGARAGHTSFMCNSTGTLPTMPDAPEGTMWHVPSCCCSHPSPLIAPAPRSSYPPALPPTPLPCLAPDVRSWMLANQLTKLLLVSTKQALRLHESRDTAVLDRAWFIGSRGLCLWGKYI